MAWNNIIHLIHIIHHTSNIIHLTHIILQPSDIRPLSAIFPQPSNIIHPTDECRGGFHQGGTGFQAYPNKGFLDVCIADRGVSLLGSYEKLPDKVIKEPSPDLKHRPRIGGEK